jgi:hypothetical protein
LQIEAEEARAGSEEFAEGKTGTEASKTKGSKDADFVESDHPRDEEGGFRVGAKDSWFDRALKSLRS